MMNSHVTTSDNNEILAHEWPGARLAAERQRLQYSLEFVASKLHLRVRLVELLEADDYHNMPQPVFIKGYLRAYANLLGLPFDSFLETFNRVYTCEHKVEKALWQRSRETNRAERTVRWLTTLFAVSVVVAVGF